MTRTETITVPMIGAVGDMRLIVVGDSDGDVFELNEGNNAAISELTINVPGTLTLSLPINRVAEDAANPVIRAVVTRSGLLTNPLVVSTLSDDESELTAAASVTIQAGQPSAAFEISVPTSLQKARQ